MHDGTSEKVGANAFSQVPVEVTVSVGCARPKISDLLALERNAVLLLDKRVDDPVELYIGEKLIARGELIEQDDGPEGQRHLAVRLIEIADLGDGLRP
jgi:flagellar motor switch protein FliN/FliY